MKRIEPEAFREALALHMIFRAAGVSSGNIFVIYEAVDPTSGGLGLGVMAKHGELTFTFVVGPHGLSEDFAMQWSAAVKTLHSYTDEEARQLLYATQVRDRATEIFAAMAAKGFQITSPMRRN